MHRHSPRHFLLALAVIAITTTVGCGSSSSTAPKASDLFAAGFKAQVAGRTDEAIADYKAAVALDPQDKGSWYDLGVIAQSKGQTAQAETYYRTALIIDPNYAPALFNLAILVTPSDTWAAIDLYRHLIGLNPRDAKSHLNLGFALKSVGQGAEGQAEINVAVQLDPHLFTSSPAGTPTPKPSP